jgi:hypothetical protein
MVTDDKYDEFNENEGVAIINKHWEKTVDTLKKLMNTMNMMYFFEKLKFKIQELTRFGNRPSLVHLEKIMSRVLKLYQMIDNFMKIFKLIDQKEVSFAQRCYNILGGWKELLWEQRVGPSRRTENLAVAEKGDGGDLAGAEREPDPASVVHFQGAVFADAAEEAEGRIHRQKETLQEEQRRHQRLRLFQIHCQVARQVWHFQEIRQA